MAKYRLKGEYKKNSILTERIKMFILQIKMHFINYHSSLNVCEEDSTINRAQSYINPVTINIVGLILLIA